MDLKFSISRRRFVSLAAGLAAMRIADLAGSRAAHAADAYPSRPVKWVVPYTAGGATDVISRLVCQYLSESLGQPFVVVNEPEPAPMWHRVCDKRRRTATRSF